ncbi:polysaccharide pyruvyl transferase family protein [Idiomarina sp.]|uniref:polysaccharide pyruvyl transferase family protein n=1 Tax=Idiomarina sp. TaxID=1874361 RepID=UPI0025C1F6FF|nr:polysaccharide pyruvyl transferase family protein [Idiomarina sp.]NQZ03480.1 polysaccharide pyruvyl transferase family protein [Idiomarina sp.]
MKIYLDLDEIDSIKTPYVQSSSDIMKITGNNIGNFAFRHALRFLVKEIESYKVVNWGDARRLINEEVRVEKVILSCANWLGFSDADERSNLVRAKIIEDFSAPVVAFGLGAQASNVDEKLEFGPNTARLAKAIAKHSEQISVRDEFTLSLLKKIGIENAIVTGCPSNFINQSSSFIKRLATQAENGRRKKLSLQKFIIGEFSGGNKHSGGVLRRSLEFMKETNSNYLIQSPVLLPFFLNESASVPSPYTANKPKDMSLESLEAILRQQVLGFSSVDAWMDFSRSCDLSFGMRIHGNMIPLQSGVPSVLIAHDSRTLGLSESMSFPKVSLSDFLGAELREIPELMYTQFLNQLPEYEYKRQTLSDTFKKFLSINDV